MSNMKKPLPYRVVSAILLANLFVFCVLQVNGEPHDSENINSNNNNNRFGDSGSNVGIFIHGGSVGGTVNAADLKCPRVCTCTGQTVDCSHRALQQIPRRTPLDTERL